MSFQFNYSSLDRLLHRLAFSAPSIQLMAADIERMVFGAFYGGVQVSRPIFLTSLPRAGTTILLEALCRFPSLATHSYRDMPFVMAPVLWSRLSRAFHKGGEMRERAHGDGVKIGYDSPEAFEEIIWRAFWPEKYSDNRIALWEPADRKDEASTFFSDHMKKIVALRRNEISRPTRYISKNNANIARIDLIRNMFPDAKFLVPVRRPLEHAVSLFRQHRNFLKMHADEPFIRRYMADIGHYEFGRLHRPISFPSFDSLTAGRDPLTVEYWLAYWVAAFEHVLARRDAIITLSYEAICSTGRAGLRNICAQLDIAEEGMLDSAAGLLEPRTPPKNDQFQIDPELSRRAEELYQQLIAS